MAAEKIVSKENGYRCKMRKIFKGPLLYCRKFPNGKFCQIVLYKNFEKLS